MGWNREGISILNEVDRVSPMEYSGVGQAMWKPGGRALKQGEQTVQSPGDGSGLDMFEDGKETADFRAESGRDEPWEGRVRRWWAPSHAGPHRLL